MVNAPLIPISLNVTQLYFVLQNYGAFFDDYRAGVCGFVDIVGRNGDEIVTKDLAGHQWVYKNSLHGLDNQLYSQTSKFSAKWQLGYLPVNRSMTWYKVLKFCSILISSLKCLSISVKKKYAFQIFYRCTDVITFYDGRLLSKLHWERIPLFWICWVWVKVMRG